MALRTSLVAQPHLYMGDTTGRPLDAGKVYFGQPNKDPELYPINVFYDEALSIAAPQPVRTKGGFMNAQGDMVEVYASEINYSVKILDSYGRQVFYSLEMSKGNTDASVITKLPYAGAVSRTQNDKNAEYITIDDFGGDFVKAGEWLKQSVSNYCYLQAGETYTINGSGEVFFNRFICRDGIAQVVVPAETTLVAVHNSNGNEIVRIEGIEYIVLGHRLGVSGGTPKAVYKNQSNLVVESSYISNCNMYALTSLGDMSSWSDDTGKTRCSGFIYLKVSGSAVIKNVNHYGFGVFYSVISGSTEATHTEENVTGYNNQTCVFISESVFLSGKSKDISIINTKAQQGYYINKNNEPENGKDVVLCEATHTEKYEIESISGTHVIERSSYIQSSNVFAKNLSDKSSVSGTNLKTTTDGRKANVDGLRVFESAEDTVPASSMATYGYDDIVINNIDIESLKTPTAGTAIVLQDSGAVTLNNVTVKNKIAAVLYSSRGVKTTNSISINNISILDCAIAFIMQVKASAILIQNLNIFRLNMVASDKSKLSASPLDLHGVNNATVRDSHFMSKDMCFNSEFCNTLNIHNSEFNLYSLDDVYTVWAKWHGADEYYRSIGLVGFAATTFDFYINFLAPTGVNRYKLKLHMLKQADTGKAHLANHWKRGVGTIPILASANTVTKLFHFDAIKPFKLIASINKSQIELVYDAETLSFVERYNVGTAFSTTSTASGISFSVDGGRNLLCSVGSSWSGGSGNVEFSFERF